MEKGIALLIFFLFLNILLTSQEQIEMECKSRRNYPCKWSKFYQETPWKEMYNQNEINQKIKTDLNGIYLFIILIKNKTKF